MRRDEVDTYPTEYLYAGSIGTDSLSTANCFCAADRHRCQTPSAT